MNCTKSSALAGMTVSVAAANDSALRPSIEPLFPAGQRLATPAALRTLLRHGIAYETLLHRHVHGDWGDLNAEDREQNELALREGARLLSAYALGNALVGRDLSQQAPMVWVITDADRACTTVLLPDDY